MLSAEEARQELKKDVLDRLPQKQREEVEIYLELFQAELERRISANIEKQLLKGESNLDLRVRFIGDVFYSYRDEFFLSHWDIFNSLGMQKDVQGDIGSVYMDKTKQAIEEQMEELREIGYQAECRYDVKNSFNNMIIEINWEEPEVETHMEPEEPEGATKEVEEKETIYILSENESLMKRWFGK